MADPKYAQPSSDGLEVGDYYSVKTVKPGNQRSTVTYVWSGSAWEIGKPVRGEGRELKKSGFTREDNEFVDVPEGYDGAFYFTLAGTDGTGVSRNEEFIVARDLMLSQQQHNNLMTRIQRPADAGANYTNAVLKYPDGATIGKDSDYVLFEFKRYQPPFKDVDMFAFKQDGDTVRLNLKGDNGDKINATIDDLSAWNKGSYDYNQSNSYKDAGEQFPSIIMYMPEDISTGFRGNWGGKSFSTVGAGILGAAGQAGLLQKMGAGFGVIGKGLERSLGLTAAKILQKSVKAAGGDQLSNNDIFGSVSGAIMNPNTELLFQAIDMRNFMLKFKLVPREQGESAVINRIVKVFKACTLPLRNPGQVMGLNDPEKSDNNGVIDAFIGVPNLCKVSFMRGPSEHMVLPRYKMLAVTQVDVNYTPDGAYATYDDAQPVAIELSINFQETKINFAEEVLSDHIR
tara:strand:- start:629 stop:1996 length:1368 start_codon:yes stop_codon:yes gene_type:complete